MRDASIDLRLQVPVMKKGLLSLAALAALTTVHVQWFSNYRRHA
jgi:hypothetical protein